MSPKPNFSVTEAGPNGRRIRRPLTGASTILKHVKDNHGLMVWANRKGLEGYTLDEAQQLHEDRGHSVHDIIEAWVRGGTHEEPVIPEGTEPRVQAGVEALVRWVRREGLVFLGAEVPLVLTSQTTPGLALDLEYCGQLDGIAQDPDGRLVIVDWKATGRIYYDYAAQVAAYHYLVRHGGMLPDWDYDPRLAEILALPPGDPARTPDVVMLVRLTPAGGLQVVTLDADTLACGWRLFDLARRVAATKRALKEMMA